MLSTITSKSFKFTLLLPALLLSQTMIAMDYGVKMRSQDQAEAAQAQRATANATPKTARVSEFDLRATAAHVANQEHQSATDFESEFELLGEEFIRDNLKEMQKEQDLKRQSNPTGMPFQQSRGAQKNSSPEDEPNAEPKKDADVPQASPMPEKSNVESKRSVSERADHKYAADHAQSTFDFNADQKRKGPYEPRANDSAITPELARSILANCPKKITDTIALLKNKNTPHAKQARKLLLVGPPGTGKSSVGKAIAQHLNIPFFMYDASTIGNEYQGSGAQNIENIFVKAAQLNTYCIIIIDEMDRLFALHDDFRHDASGLFNRLFTILEDPKFHRIIFIGTSNDSSKMPAPFFNRFQKDIVEFPLPTEVQRRAIITHLLQAKSNFTFEPDLSVQLAKKTNNFPPRSLENLIQDAAESACLRENNTIVTADDIAEAFKNMRKNDPASTSELDDKIAQSVREQEIEGINSIIDLFHKINGDIQNCAVLKRTILAGPPCNGKSTIGKAIATSCGIPCHIYNALDYQFNSEGFEKLFEKASQSKKPCVIMLDDLQLLVNPPKSTNPDRLLALRNLLNKYDQYPIMFIGTFDDSTGVSILQLKNQLKTGRIINIPLPNDEQIVKMYFFYFRFYERYHFPYDDVATFSHLVKEAKSQKFSRKELNDVIDEAINIAVKTNSDPFITGPGISQAFETVDKTKKQLKSDKRWRNLRDRAERILPHIPGLASLFMNQRNFNASNAAQANMHAQSMAAQANMHAQSMEAARKAAEANSFARQVGVAAVSAGVGAGINVGATAIQEHLRSKNLNNSNQNNSNPKKYN
jgi:SpoVK/Ycf46/Vps4 family AAA+-type ATPase